eukprot:3920838-Prymnesium_polylepis.1
MDMTSQKIHRKPRSPFAGFPFLWLRVCPRTVRCWHGPARRRRLHPSLPHPRRRPALCAGWRRQHPRYPRTPNPVLPAALARHLQAEQDAQEAHQ